MSLIFLGLGLGGVELSLATEGEAEKHRHYCHNAIKTSQNHWKCKTQMKQTEKKCEQVIAVDITDAKTEMKLQWI